MKRRIISLCAVVLLLFFALPAEIAAAGPGSSELEVLVRFQPGTTMSEMAAVHRQAGGRPQDLIPAIGVHVVSLPARAVAARMRSYAAHPLVMYAEPNYIAQVVGEPNDPYYSAQWGLHKVEAPAAWDTTTGSAGVSIAILDTGVDQNHPDLKDKIVKNVNFTGSSTVDDIHGHGTHVAGIAAASTNNGIGVAGMGYDSTIMNVKVLGDDGSGYYSWVASGITWAADNGARVINMSLGGTSSSKTLEDAINYAWNKGVVVVAAAGNSGSTSPSYPAYYANCMAVAATDRYDNKPSWSNYGDWVDVAAPGVSIYATLKGSSYGYKSGTSMASPFVAGLAALVFTVVGDENGNGRLNDEVRARIESTCDDIGISGIGSGRINAARAVGAYDAEPEPEPDPEPGVEIALSADPASVSQAGTMVTYTYTVTNTGDVTLTGLAITDSELGSIPIATTLAPGADTTGTATYTVTQADIDDGADIVNTATVTTDQAVTASDSATVTVVQQPAVDLALAADPASVSQAGDVIDYTYTVSNTGKVTLTGIAVTDDLLGDITLGTTTLAPGAYTTGTGTYTVTQADIDSGADIVNTATVTTDEAVTDSDGATVTVDAPEAPAPGVTISPAEQDGRGWGGDTVAYDFTVQNTGNVPDTYDISVASGWNSSVTPQSIALEPGASVTITVTHSVPLSASRGDYDAGTVQVLSSATGAAASATFTTTARVAAVQISPGKQSGSAVPGQTVQYTYTISNTGSEDDVYDLALSSGWEASLSTTYVTLPPGESADVVVSHTVLEGAESGTFDAGSLTVASDRASAGATFTTTAEEAPEPVPPVIDLFMVTDRSNRAWAWVTVDWAVSDEDDDLASVEVLMVLDGSVVDSVTYYASGYEASGSCELRHRSRRGTAYDVVLIVTDAHGNTTSQTRPLSS